jgi:hypothetical protein
MRVTSRKVLIVPGTLPYNDGKDLCTAGIQMGMQSVNCCKRLSLLFVISGTNVPRMKRARVKVRSTPIRLREPTMSGVMLIVELSVKSFRSTG